jgi:hypothetical protein
VTAKSKNSPVRPWTVATTRHPPHPATIVQRRAAVAEPNVRAPHVATLPVSQRSGARRVTPAAAPSVARPSAKRSVQRSLVDPREEKLHSHSYSPPDWRNYILRELESIPIHHKFPKRSLQFLWDHMTGPQQEAMSKLGVSGPRDLKSLPFLLIKGQTKGNEKKIVPPESRIDDPDHPKKDLGALEELRRMLEEQLNKNKHLDLVYHEGGNVTPRSGVVIELNKVYRKICYDFLDSSSPDTYTIPNELFHELFAVLEEGVYTHFALSGGTNELWTYDWKEVEDERDSKKYFYLPEQSKIEKPSLFNVKEAFEESEKRRKEELEKRAKSSSLVSKYREALSVLEYWPPPVEDDTPEEHMRRVIRLAFGSREKDEEWSDV